MKRYPKYKNSGVEWMGKIPVHWDTMIVKRIVKDHKQGYYTQQDYVDSGVKLLRITDIYDNSDIDLSNCPYVSITEKERQDFGLKINDFIFARSGTIGRFGIVRKKSDVVFASYLIRFRFLENILSDFLKYYFLSDFFKLSLISDLHGGANQNIHAENIKNQIVAIPNIQDQKSIANYLDHKTHHIDNLIQKKQKQIELLKEQRTAIINHAVTKGLNPDVKMKDSGIEWLGEIPAHWEVVKLKHIIQPNGLIRGPFGSALKTSFFVNKGYKVYEQKNAIKNDHTTGNSYVDEDKYNELKRFSVKENDIIMSCSGTIGKMVRIPKSFEPGIINQALLIMRFDNINISFFENIFESNVIQTQIVDHSQGSAMKNLVGMDIFKNIKLTYPPRIEQKQINSYLKKKTDQIEKTIYKVERETELLKEYRTTLISDAVTGKIDVRDEVPV